MNREDKALLYDNIVREGDRLNRQLSVLKGNLNPTPQQEQEVAGLKQQLVVLEQRMNELFINE